MAQPHEFGRGRMLRLPSHRSGIRARYCQACLTHTAITPPAGQSARSKAALRGDTAPDGVSHLLTLEPPDGKALPFTLQRSTIPATTGIGAPLTSRHTPYVAVHPNRRGAMPTDRVHRLIYNKLARGFSRWRGPRRSPTGPGRAALH